jgi:hypothetical protein
VQTSPSFVFLTSCSVPAALEKPCLRRPSALEEAPGFSRRPQLHFLGLFGVVRVHGMRDSQSVAGLRYTQVEGMPPQPAVRLHQDLVGSAPVDESSGFDQVVQQAEAPGHAARPDAARTALAAARRDNHDRTMLAVSPISVL